MRGARAFAIAASVLVIACRAPYPAPGGRTIPESSPTSWDATAPGAIETFRTAERHCIAGLSPRAVSAAFQAVDEVADALSDLCSIAIVDDDPLVWHVWCGSDATFQSGHYLAPTDRAVSCDGGNADNAFECIGRILARHLLSREMSRQVEGVEIVSIGSVDAQILRPDTAFLGEPCVDLQRELALAEASRWERPEGEPDADSRSGIWNQRLSWCRAAESARQLRRGMSRSIGGQYELAAIGAGTDWLDSYRQRSRRACPSTGERGRGQCRDARRVDLYVRIRAEQGSQGVEPCRPPPDFPGAESGEVLYCYSDCQARAAIGRNPEGFSAPRARADLLFGASAAAPEGWIGDRSAGGQPVNHASVRALLLRR